MTSLFIAIAMAWLGWQHGKIMFEAGVLTGRNEVKLERLEKRRDGPRLRLVK